MSWDARCLPPPPPPPPSPPFPEEEEHIPKAKEVRIEGFTRESTIFLAVIFPSILAVCVLGFILMRRYLRAHGQVAPDPALARETAYRVHATDVRVAPPDSPTGPTTSRTMVLTTANQPGAFLVATSVPLPA